MFPGWTIVSRRVSFQSGRRCGRTPLLPARCSESTGGPTAPRLYRARWRPRGGHRLRSPPPLLSPPPPPPSAHRKRARQRASSSAASACHIVEPRSSSAAEPTAVAYGVAGQRWQRRCDGAAVATTVWRGCSSPATVATTTATTACAGGAAVPLTARSPNKNWLRLGRTAEAHHRPDSGAGAGEGTAQGGG